MYVPLPQSFSRPERMISLNRTLDCPVSRIALVSPERSKQIETILIRMAQSGQLRGRVSEAQLIDLLDQASRVQHYIVEIFL